MLVELRCALLVGGVQLRRGDRIEVGAVDAAHLIRKGRAAAPPPPPPPLAVAPVAADPTDLPEGPTVAVGE